MRLAGGLLLETPLTAGSFTAEPGLAWLTCPSSALASSTAKLPKLRSARDKFIPETMFLSVTVALQAASTEKVRTGSFLNVQPIQLLAIQANPKTYKSRSKSFSYTSHPNKGYNCGARRMSTITRCKDPIDFFYGHIAQTNSQLSLPIDPCVHP